MTEIIYRHPAELHPHPENSLYFDDITGQKWEEFKESIKRNGVLQPLIITPGGLIVSGHQRFRACQALNIDKIPCIVQAFDDDKAVLKAMIEINIRQRGVVNSPSVKLGRILKALEEINGTKDTKNKPKQWRDDLKISRNTASRSRKLADLPPEYQTMLENGTITAQTALEVVTKLAPDQQKTLAEMIAQGKISSLKAIKQAMMPEAETVEALNARLEDAEKARSETETALRARLDQAQRRERYTFELLQAEKRRRKRQEKEFERRFDKLEEMHHGENLQQTIKDLAEQLEEERHFAETAQRDADLTTLCAVLGAAINSLAPIAQDPAPLQAPGSTQAEQLITQTTEILTRIKRRLLAVLP